MPPQKKQTSDSRIASLRLQDEEYNKQYRSWRIEHKKDFGFYFAGASDELIYRDGEGMINEHPEASELSALTEIISVIGKTLIMYTIINILTSFFFADLPISISHRIFYNKDGFFTGDEASALILSYIVNILRRIIPLCYLLFKVRMPLKLMIPLKVVNKPLFYQSVPMSMLVFGITTMLSGFTSTIYSLLGFDHSNRIWIPESMTAMVLSSLLYTFILPILSEFVHRGIMMQTLRQFGDGFALVVTSVIAATTAQSANHYFFTFVYSIVIGYFSARSGSILTAFLMRIVISVSSYWLTYIRLTLPPEEDYLTISLIITLIYLTAGVYLLIRFIKKHSNKINLPIYEMYISIKDKLLCCLTNPYIIIWLSLSLMKVALSGGILL